MVNSKMAATIKVHPWSMALKVREVPTSILMCGYKYHMFKNKNVTIITNTVQIIPHIVITLIRLYIYKS